MSKTESNQPPPFVYVIYINSAPDKVWAALTMPEFTEKYWGGRRIISDWKPGSAVKFLKPDGAAEVKGEILACDPPRELSYTFDTSVASGGAASAPSRVTFKIAAPFGSTQLTVVHEGLEPGSRAFFAITQGWPAILSSLKTLLETGAPLPSTWKG